MAVSTRHPEMDARRLSDFRTMRDTMVGAQQVKAAGTLYLPKPSGFASHGDGGDSAYEAYKKRADFEELVAPTVAEMVGIVHAKETQIELPDAMAPIWENADGDGLTLEAFHRRITRNLLWLGRYGILTDAPAGGGMPFMAGYCAETIINWDSDFYVLDESEMRRDGFQWSHVERYRVLRLDGPAYVAEVHEGGSVTDVTPRRMGGGTLDVVPFVVGNARDLVPHLDTPPLIGVGNAAIAIYQLSADYRHQLFMSGQETLVAINGPAPQYVGAGVVHEMNEGGDQGNQPDLKYVGPSAKGIEAHKVAMEQQRRAAARAGAKLFDESEHSQESGDARRLRFAAETASIMSVALVSAGLLERGLRNVAVMMGQNPDAVVVTPPSDLMDNTMQADALERLFNVYDRGGMSWQTYYEAAQKGGIMSPERDADAEFSLIDGQQFGGDAI